MSARWAISAGPTSMMKPQGDREGVPRPCGNHLHRERSEADSERSIEQLARTGHKLIFTTSFGFMEPTLKVAKKYPNVMFEHATASSATRTWRPIPPSFMKALHYRQDRRQDDQDEHSRLCRCHADSGSDRRINAFYLGAKIGQPERQDQDCLVNAWFDPARKAMPPRRCWTRVPLSSPSTRIARRRCSRQPRAANSPSASLGHDPIRAEQHPVLDHR